MNIDDAKRILKLVPMARRAVRNYKKEAAVGKFVCFGRDTAGCEIRVGYEVAFNRSGNVVRGKVIAIVRPAFKGTLAVRPKAGDCRIECVTDNKISSVKWPESILVISMPIPS